MTTVTVATVPKKKGSISIALSSYRVELRSNGTVLAFDVDQLPALIQALRRTEAEAVTRCLLRRRDRTGTERQARWRERHRRGGHG